MPISSWAAASTAANRVFAEEPDGIRTEAADPAKMEDPSLIIYHPVRQMGRGLIITNGDQTDTIRDFLEKGLPFEQALRTREFEPDGPNWTPRISGLLSPDGSYKLSIIKAADEAGTGCLRQTFEYPGQPGLGHFHPHLQVRWQPHPLLRRGAHPRLYRRGHRYLHRQPVGELEPG